MRLLLIHQNFPGQFRTLAPHLKSLGHDVIAVASHNRPVAFDGTIIRYPEPQKLEGNVPFGTSLWHEALLRAKAVSQLCYSLKQQGWIPDRILAHSGWGESLALHHVWPNTPQILWPELWVRPEHGGYGTDPQKPKPTLEQDLEQLGRNSITREALFHARNIILPTVHQLSSFPKSLVEGRAHVIHEGIDVSIARPNDHVSFQIRDFTFDRSVPVLTLVNRNLERMRGFDVFMRSLPPLMRNNPGLRIIVVGGNEAGYGGSDGQPSTLRSRMMRELEGKLDLNRLHFMGRVPYDQLIAIFQASWIHVYISYPFVLGWSLIEAMSCGCCIVGSKGMPVEEVVTNGVDGVLVDHDSPVQLCNRIQALLDNPKMRHTLGTAAREKALLYDKQIHLQKICDIIES